MQIGPIQAAQHNSRQLQVSITMASPIQHAVGFLLLIFVLTWSLCAGQTAEPNAVVSECNVCSVSSSQACVSENQFRSCVDGTPTGQAYTCGSGQKCSLLGTCQPAASITSSPCAGCKVCSDSKTFACTGTKTFALCLGSDSLSQITGTCNDDLYCNVYNPNICGKIEDGFPSTCSYEDDPTTLAPTTTTTTTTPSPSKNPAEFCNVVAEPGRYPVGTDLATTCKQYVRCVQNGDGWAGLLYYCPGGTYYNSALKACGTDVPARCAGGVRSLNLLDLELN